MSRPSDIWLKPLGAQASDRNGINVRTNKEMERGTRSGAELGILIVVS